MAQAMKGAPRHGTAQAGDEQLDHAFVAALAAVQSAPDSQDAWDRAEELADALQRPEDVAGIYRQILERTLPDGLRAQLSRRAARFYEEWFGDNADTMAGLLLRLVETDPDARWAFERLVVLLTVAERWDALLHSYDRVLAHTRDPDWRRQLLDEAAQVAKDFAADPNRAVDYLRSLLALDPGQPVVAASLERLLERQHRYDDLVALWQERLAGLPGPEARDLRVRIAATLLDSLDAPGRALDELRALVAQAPGDGPACEQLERILAAPGAPLAVRMGALALLRTSYDAAGRPADALAAIGRALEFAPASEHVALHRELGARSAIAGRDAEAIIHYGSLLELEPTDTDARKQLRQVAQRSGLFGPLVEALVRAAEAAEGAGRMALRHEAAQICVQELHDLDRAASLLGQVVGDGDADRALALSAAHQLSELLAQSSHDGQRLAVLERLADFERSASLRWSVLAEAGRLADALGDPDRALSAHQRRLDSADEDPQALDDVIDLLERHGRWEPLMAALRRRATAAGRPLQRRADLIRIARIQRDELDAIGDAIETWTQVRREFGDEPETVDALDTLLREAMRAPERAAIAHSASQQLRDRVCELLNRVGEVQHRELGDPQAALAAYAEAARIAPDNEPALAGLTALLEEPAVALGAATALADAFDKTGSWQAWLGLVERRVRLSTPAQAIGILREAARLHELEGGDAKAALEAIVHGFTLDPTDAGLEHELLRLAEATGRWETAAEAYRTAVAVAAHPARAIHLHIAEAQIRQRHLADPAGAARAYEAAANLDAQRLDLQQALLQACAATGQWDRACAALVALGRAQPGVPLRTLETLGELVASRQEWPAFLPALERTLAAANDLDDTAARELNLACARWQLEHAEAPTAAAPAALRAVRAAPDHRPALTLLAQVHRASADPALVDVLLHLDTLEGDQTNHLEQAAHALLAQEPDSAKTRAVLGRLYAKAARLLAVEGPQAAPARHEVVLWSVTHWAQACLAAQDRRAALGAFTSAAELPLSRAEVIDLRIRAARLGVEVGDREQAIDLLHQALDARGDDLALVRELADLCEQDGRVLELIRLRTRELELTDDGQRKLALRLELSRLIGNLEQQGGRIDALRRNLSESPGHAPSLSALAEILHDKGRPAVLADILEDQARTLEAQGDRARAAELWASAANLSEHHIGDLPRAVAALTRQVALAPNVEALDTLARLHLALGDPATAAHCLHQRQGLTEAAAVVPVLVRLARAQLQAGQDSQAIATLEAAFAEAPKNGEVRKLLLNIYRSGEQWEPLARALLIAAEAITDGPTVLAYAREAAAIYGDRLGAPELCVPVLERALALTGGDRELRSRLAEGLRAAGRLEDARRLLLELIEDFGRRRSPERAAAHLALARVLRAQDERAEALDQLELASGMDASHPEIMLLLAETARDDGQLERAERAYRALLVLVRRSSAEPASPHVMGAAQVLFELAAIANLRGQVEQADELIESGLEALRLHDADAPQLQARLASQGQHGLLRRVLEVRLQQVPGPRHRAQILSALAELQAHAFGNRELALEVALESVLADPASPELHDRARELASELGRLDEYAAQLEHQIDGARRFSDAQVRAELLLRLGEVMEKDRGDLARARELYGQAEQTGVREIDVWRALARVAAELGDTAEHLRMLERLASLGDDGSETRADALYRMAEVQLGEAESRAEGLATLRQALEVDARWERAVRILWRATDPDHHEPSAEPLKLFEQVARRSADDEAILAALERRAALPDTSPEDLREAVDLADARGELALAERLMQRALELGQLAAVDPSRLVWAQLGLARRRHDAGDPAGAIRWLVEAAACGRVDELLPLAQAVVAHPQVAADPALGGRVYEAILERDPSLQGAWEPLAELYRRAGDGQRLRRLVDETLDSLPGPTERNALRLLLGQTLVEQGDPQGEAVQILQDILAEQPDHPGAQEQLLHLLEQAGRVDEVIALARTRLLSHQGRGDAQAIVTDSLSLAERLAPDDPDEAREILRTALQWAPDEPRLLQAIVALIPADQVDERVELSLRIMDTVGPDVAAALALDLADTLAEQGQLDTELRVLGRAQALAPTHAGLQARLEAAYEARDDHRAVAELLRARAASEQDAAVRLGLWLRSAVIYRERLDDMHGATTVLEQARTFDERDPDLGLALAQAWAAQGHHTRARELLSDLLGDAESRAQPQLRTARAELRLIAGDIDGAVADLEAVLTQDPETIAPRLVQALEQQRAAAQLTGDVDTERRALLRSVEVLVMQGERDQARAALGEWIERERKDAEALRLLQGLDTQDGRWDAVAKTCGRLVAIESGPAQVEAALALSAACNHLGRPEDARAGLEHARRKQPGVVELRDELRRIYSLVGAHRELARLLAQDADETADEALKLDLLQRAVQLFDAEGDHESALPLLHALLELQPGNLTATLGLADAYLGTGQLDQADALLDEALVHNKGRRGPDLAAIYHRKARVAEARGDVEQHLAALETAFGLDKTHGLVAAELADLAEQRQNWDLATKVLRTITLLDTPCPISRAEAFLRQAKIALQRGDRTRAVLWARKARHEEPESGAVAEFLAALGEG